jgi:hypothetical protein
MKTPRAIKLLISGAAGAALSVHSLAEVGPRIVARVGDPVPGITGAIFTGFDAPVINNGGTVAFKASFSGGDATALSNEALFAGPPNAPIVRVREGEIATLQGESYGFIDPRIVLADDGNLFFAAQLTGVTVTPSNDRVLMVKGTPGADTILLREGDSLGGTLTVAPTGLNFQPASGILFANRDGHAAVIAGVVDSLSPGANGFAVLHLNGGDGNDVIAVSNGPAPEGLGTFTPQFTGANPFVLIGVGPLGGVTFRGGGNSGGQPFDAFVHFDSETGTSFVVAKTGDQATGAKPGFNFGILGPPSATGGGLVIFDSILQRGDAEPDFTEIGHYTKYAKYRAALEALRDRSARKTGGVFAGFPASVVNQNGTTGFIAELFKRPDGFPPGQGVGVFGGPGKPQLIAQSGNPVPGLPGTTITSFNFGGLSVTNGNQVFVLSTAEPNLSTVLVSTFPGNGPPSTEIFLQDGLSIPAGAANDTLNAFDFPFGGTTSSDGKPRSVNDSGTAVIECVFATNGNSIYYTGTPKAPDDVRQPDIILNEKTKVGDDVHQSKAANPQTPEREQAVNTAVDYVFFIQNDGTVQDEIEVSSSGKDARDRLKWFLGDDDTMEISDAVFGDGRKCTLQPGEKIKIRLRANRQTLENKGKTDKVKIKATSTADKKARDQFQLSIKYNPV